MNSLVKQIFLEELSCNCTYGLYGDGARATYGTGKVLKMLLMGISERLTENLGKTVG